MLKESRNGSGRNVFKYYDLLKEIYGSPVVTKSIPLVRNSTHVQHINGSETN